MAAIIEFIKGINETTLPFVKMTKSTNGKTGTATFIFVNPISFFKIGQIDEVSLISEEEKISITELEIIFKNGKPYFLRAILFIKNSEDWFKFLNFMSMYAKQQGLIFSETKGLYEA